MPTLSSRFHSAVLQEATIAAALNDCGLWAWVWVKNACGQVTLGKAHSLFRILLPGTSPASRRTRAATRCCCRWLPTRASPALVLDTIDTKVMPAAHLLAGTHTTRIEADKSRYPVLLSNGKPELISQLPTLPVLRPGTPPASRPTRRATRCCCPTATWCRAASWRAAATSRWADLLHVCLMHGWVGGKASHFGCLVHGWVGAAATSRWADLTRLGLHGCLMHGSLVHWRWCPDVGLGGALPVLGGRESGSASGSGASCSVALPLNGPCSHLHSVQRVFASHQPSPLPLQLAVCRCGRTPSASPATCLPWWRATWS